MFAGDMSVFSVIQDITLSVTDLNADLKNINKWYFYHKMSFNLDLRKQAQDGFFYRKLIKLNPSLNFDNMVVIQSTDHKHLAIILDTKLNFKNTLS